MSELGRWNFTDRYITGKIVPTEYIGPSGKHGSVIGHTFAEISDVLGFEPNKSDDPDKVDGGKSWAFRYDNVENTYNYNVNIWSWKGSGLREDNPSFSFSGPPIVLASIFGESYVVNK